MSVASLRIPSLWKKKMGSNYLATNQVMSDWNTVAYVQESDLSLQEWDGKPHMTLFSSARCPMIRSPEIMVQSPAAARGDANFVGIHNWKREIKNSGHIDELLRLQHAFHSNIRDAIGLSDIFKPRNRCTATRIPTDICGLVADFVIPKENPLPHYYDDTLFICSWFVEEQFVSVCDMVNAIIPGFTAKDKLDLFLCFLQGYALGLQEVLHRFEGRRTRVMELTKGMKETNCHLIVQGITIAIDDHMVAGI